ncbi:MAG: response regulator [Spirochaetaceae bacterium]|nr:response regulator [Spirochaetaceae bacterium]
MDNKRTVKKNPLSNFKLPLDGEPLRILIAEDDEVNRLYLQTLLNRKGFSVEEAINGSEAVKRCQANPYHLVLMDVSMQVMDGLEATRKIRQFSPDLPIVAVTAHAYEEDQKRIRESGMNAVVLKPIDEKKLMKQIEVHLKGLI